jgi:CelD/BcsL family acetyltransferase involved in cellulose biosynthesis
LVRFALFRPERLSPELVATWSQIQETEPALGSPYFRPEFVQDVAAVRTDVEVAVFNLNGLPVGFFPFQRGMFNIGCPVGGLLSDFQGAIVRSDIEWNAEELVSGCNLAGWFFDHLITSQKAFAIHRSAMYMSPFIDLSRGFEAYCDSRRKAGSQTLSQVARKLRKAEREIGPVRFEACTDSYRAWQELLKWKTSQYKRTEATNAFIQPWTREFIKKILQRRELPFSGMLSRLFIGDRVAALHLGMRSFDILHWWLPAYDPALRDYSPGLILLLELAKASEELGIRRIDLGRGAERYKLSFMSGRTDLYEGSVVCSRPLRTALRSWRCASEWIHSSPLIYPAARTFVRILRKMRASPL